MGRPIGSFGCIKGFKYINGGNKYKAVMYCSRRCREDAFNRSHRIECQIYSFSQDFPVTSSLSLPIRTLMVLTSQGENLKTLMRDPHFKNPMKKPLDLVPQKFDSQNSVHLLSLTEDTRLLNDKPFKFPNVALIFYQVLTVSCILRQTACYGSKMVTKDQKRGKVAVAEEKYVGLLFLKLVMSIPTYTFGVMEILQENVNSVMMQSDSADLVGNGLYLFHSMFNHSCFPNVGRSFHKDTMVTRALQPIKAGQQLFLSYGPDFLTTPRIERLKHLRAAYKFKCCCEACEHNWPQFEEMWEMPWEFLPDGQISSQQYMHFLEEITKFLRNPSRLIEYNIELFNFFCEYATLFHENLKNPCLAFSFCYQVLQFLSLSRGNNYVYTRDSVLMSL